MTTLPQFLSDEFRFRQGWFGKLILQRKVRNIQIRGYSGNGWVDANIHDIFDYFRANQLPVPIASLPKNTPSSTDNEYI
jgi:hypothetical protein